jgi:serine/threonine protein kinase
MSAYPQFSEYNQIIGRPDVFFSDPQIKQRVRALDKTGLPIYVSGRFAFTFKFVMPDQSRPIAVRCFQEEIPDLLIRYRAIDNFLRRLRSDFFVDFALSAPTASSDKAGVLIHPDWLPVVRMDWVEGQILSDAVRRRQNDTHELGVLRAELLRYSRLSEHEGFSHGDLHSDNILITSVGLLRLVDYDSLYVPALSNQKAALVGQGDYQSPARMKNPTAFGPWLDRFPLLVLDLSLAALQRRPDLLDTLKTPGEGLLLGRSDFENPYGSSLLREIERLPDLGGPVQVFREACLCSDLHQIPALDLLRRAEGVINQTVSRGASPARRRASTLMPKAQRAYPSFAVPGLISYWSRADRWAWLILGSLILIGGIALATNRISQLAGNHQNQTATTTFAPAPPRPAQVPSTQTAMPVPRPSTPNPPAAEQSPVSEIDRVKKMWTGVKIARDVGADSQLISVTKNFEGPLRTAVFYISYTDAKPGIDTIQIKLVRGSNGLGSCKPHIIEGTSGFYWCRFKDMILYSGAYAFDAYINRIFIGEFPFNVK